MLMLESANGSRGHLPESSWPALVLVGTVVAAGVVLARRNPELRRRAVLQLRPDGQPRLGQRAGTGPLRIPALRTGGAVLGNIGP